MSYQFGHVETYARKPNKAGVGTKFVFDEVTRRDPDACRHVKNPTPPTLVYGMSVEDLEALHDKMCEETKTTNAKGQTRAIRKDQHTLMTVVLSYPGQPEPGIAGYAEWERRSIALLKKQYGDDLKTVVRHTDEANPHIHAYILPSNARAKELHPGWTAKRDAEAKAKASGMDAKAALKEGNAAYKASMREWQDSLYEAVGRPCGLTRIGPARRRLTREAHTLEKEQVKRARESELRIEEAARRDCMSRDRERRIQQKEAVLNGEVGDGWFARRAKAKRLAELTADSIVERARQEGRREGLDSAKPAFEKVKAISRKKIGSLEEENARLKTQNAALIIETSKPQDYELFLDIAESTMRDLVDLKHEKAMETGQPDAFRDLSETCEQATIMGKKTDRDGLVDHVRGVVLDVKDKAKAMFRRFFGWSEKADDGLSIPPLAPAPPAPLGEGAKRPGEGAAPGLPGGRKGEGVGLGDPGKRNPRPF